MPTNCRRRSTNRNSGRREGRGTHGPGPRRLPLGYVSRQRRQPEAMTISHEPTGARGRVRSFAGALLTHPGLPAFAAALTLLLTLPALGNGWMLDDYYHRTVLRGTSRFRDLFGPPREMFRFFRG